MSKQTPLTQLLEEQKKEIAQAVLNAIEKYQNSKEHYMLLDREIEPAVSAAITKGYELALEEVEKYMNSVEPSPDTEKYIELVKNGNKDDMYDYGVLLERKKCITHIAQLKTTNPKE